MTKTRLQSIVSCRPRTESKEQYEKKEVNNGQEGRVFCVCKALSRPGFGRGVRRFAEIATNIRDWLPGIVNLALCRKWRLHPNAK